MRVFFWASSLKQWVCQGRFVYLETDWITMKPVEIIGGGVAGLALGHALANRNFPVSVVDAGRYPRHRVCGEFICGVSSKTLEALGLPDLKTEGVTHRNVAWLKQGRLLLNEALPVEVIGVSRYRMDAWIADRFRSVGGALTEGEKREGVATSPGIVDARGRRYRKGPWLGLKMHLTDFEPMADLEVHLGHRSYVGISAVEDGRYNVCGLFRRIQGLRARGPELLLAYLKRCGMGPLGERIDVNQIDVSSVIGVSHFDFRTHLKRSQGFALGDRWGVIPPFTGNGMSMALESAALAIAPLSDYARGDLEWEAACVQYHTTMRRHLKRRLGTAGSLHPFLLNPAGQKLLGWLAQSRLLPFQALFRATH
ncbi:MAG: hypothetical protein HRU10_01840 [Opitutales bacterium]|nr:hypothetical protein [Opitutales bacterium]